MRSFVKSDDSAKRARKAEIGCVTVGGRYDVRTAEGCPWQTATVMAERATGDGDTEFEVKWDGFWGTQWMPSASLLLGDHVKPSAAGWSRLAPAEGPGEEFPEHRMNLPLLQEVLCKVGRRAGRGRGGIGFDTGA